MNIKQILKRSEKFVTDNSTALLTAVGVAGTVGTAVLTGQASFKAARILSDIEHHEDTDPDRWAATPSTEKVKLVWKCYIPPVVVGGVTVTAIVFANRIGTRRAAAIAAAYSVTEKAFTEYKDKVVEVIGEKKEEAVRDAIAQDHVDANPPDNSVIVVAGKSLCLESYTGRYFETTYEAVKNAENAITAEVLRDGFASLGDFYYMLGLARTSDCEDVGWNTDRLPKIDVNATIAEDNKPCLVMSYTVVPIREYHRFR